MKLTKFLIAGAFTLASFGASAATIFSPSDGDVNFLFSTLSAGSALAIFDDEDQSFVGSNLVIDVPENIAFTDNGGSGTAAGRNGNLNLTGGTNFILGLLVNGSWLTETSVTSVGDNSFRIGYGVNGDIAEIDVQIVPIPAAAWLFGTGLIGLAGIARRKKATA